MSRDVPRPRIVVTGRIPEPGLEILRVAGDVWAWPHDHVIPDDIRTAQLADADAAVTLLTDKVDSSFLDAAPSLRVVANVAVGHNNIDLDACAARGVMVTNTPGVLTDATADLTMGLILMTTRHLARGDRLVRSGAAWQWGMFMMLGSGLQGRRLGIIGMGDIGTAVARRANAFGMHVVYHNRRRIAADLEVAAQVSSVGFHELLKTSDVVSLHCPYTAATHHLIDAAALARMKPSAHLVNTARGPIVDESALVSALENGTIAGAALDVYEHEPDVHPRLLASDATVLAPHLGSATIETRNAMAITAANNVVEVLAGRVPPNPVTRQGDSAGSSAAGMMES